MKLMSHLMLSHTWSIKGARAGRGKSCCFTRFLKAPTGLHHSLWVVSVRLNFFFFLHTARFDIISQKSLLPSSSSTCQRHWMVWWKLLAHERRRCTWTKKCHWGSPVFKINLGTCHLKFLWNVCVEHFSCIFWFTKAKLYSLFSPEDFVVLNWFEMLVWQIVVIMG